MRKNKSLLALAVLSALFVLYSCQKSIDVPASTNEVNASKAGNAEQHGVTPYMFERINSQNFLSQGWKEQQVNIISGVTSFSDESEFVQIVQGPENNSDNRLIPGSITMNLPTGANPTLRRIRLRKGGYSGTMLADLTELKFSTYVVQNAPTNMVIQIDVNGDETKDFNIFYEPPRTGTNIQHLEFNKWQQWDALAGTWFIEVATVPIPAHLTNGCRISQIFAAFPNARIIDTAPIGNNGEGVRFTIGGNPASLFANTIGYFDALIIGTRDKPVSTVFDFMLNQGND